MLLLPMLPAEQLSGEQLETWRKGERIRNRTELRPVLFVVLPGAQYTMPYGVPFHPLPCPIS